MNKIKNKSVKILRKGKSGIVKSIFSRFGLIVFLFLLQIVLMIFGFFVFEEKMPTIYSAISLLSVFMLLFLINSNMDPGSKITWLLIITTFPVFGGLLYAYVKSDIGHRVLKDRIYSINESTANLITQNEDVLSELEKSNPNGASMARYVHSKGCHPMYRCQDIVYFPSGEAKFSKVLEELEKAQKYIFLEYFIIAEGKMWGQILDILKRKAREGVDVRLMYDGTCEFSTLPHSYPKQMKNYGIKCKPFAPITPFLSTHYNYRDHRKILVIDGEVAFTGGINFADEYINEKQKYGHWKDTAIMLKGECAMSFTLMFLKMWNLDEKHKDFGLIKDPPKLCNCKENGFVLPYSDCPLDGDKVGERVYVDILNRATKYVNIMTPYLILDAVTENALKYAAERGVKVCIILPGIPDKKVPFALAKSHYKSLIDSGVEIYEYSPGFVHAKVFVCDDSEAVVGTINLDYRSLYHHFECGAYIYHADCINDIEEDYKSTLQKCTKVTKETIKKEKIGYKIAGFLLKSFAPLL